MSAAVEATGLSKTFRIYERQPTIFRLLAQFINPAGKVRDFAALNDVSFSIEAGDRVGVVGRNGAGKTTMLRILAGIYRPSGGTLRLNAEIASFFGTAGLNGNLTVHENIFLTAALHGMSRTFIRPRVDEILTFAELGDYRNRTARELSWGQSRRLLLAVFFQSPAPLILFDEGFGGVDAKFLEKLETAFDRLFRGKTVIMAAHDDLFLRRHCRRALWLDQGRLRKEGAAPEVLDAYAD